MSKSSKKRTHPNKTNEVQHPPLVPIKASSTLVNSNSAKQTASALSASSDPFSSSIDSNQLKLIRFDRRLKVFFGVCLILYVLFSTAKMHFVSIGVWNKLLPDGSDLRRGIVSGEPRQIRMDDYAVATPWFLSQANKGNPQENEVLGGEKVPVLISFSYHFVNIFRPGAWGSLIFSDFDRAFAFDSNIILILSIISITLMLLLITQNNFWLSVFGSFWLILSSGSQSWVNIPLHSITGAAFIFTSSVYLLFSDTHRQAIVSALCLSWSLCYFLLQLYPPYQVPIVYVTAAIWIGYIINQLPNHQIRTIWGAKIGYGILVAMLVVLVAYLFYADLQSTFDAITGTVYPGKRNELGGTGFIANWFSEYFSWQYRDVNFPKNWLNHCELSHYLTFTPIVIPSTLYIFFKTRRIDWVLVLLGVCIGILYIWIQVGFPSFLAQSTLMGMSPPRRSQIPFGIANVLFTLSYLHLLSKSKVQTSSLLTMLGGFGVLSYMIYAGYVNVEDSNGFFKFHQLFIPIGFFTTLGILLLPTLNLSYKVAIFSMATLLFVLPNLRLNPISRGLTPITQHSLYTTVQSISQQDPKARWVVYGSQYISYLVTATGVNLLSGVKYVPARNIYKVLDPQARRDSSYNRYAHTVYGTYINGTDSVYIQNNFEDGCYIAMDPCSPRFKTLNVKYIIFEKQPQPVEMRCMKLVSTLGSIQIYRIND